MAAPSRYRLDVSVTIVKEEWHGPVDLTGGPAVTDDRSGYWSTNQSGERLTVAESHQLGTLDFAGVMQVLGSLHEAIKAVNPS